MTHRRLKQAAVTIGSGRPPMSIPVDRVTMPLSLGLLAPGGLALRRRQSALA